MTDRAFGVLPRGWPALAAALAVGVVYYVGARIGMALTFAPLPMSVLWPPNSLLFAALMLTPRRWWWAVHRGAFPAHLLAELQGGVPLSMVLCWFVSNVAEALIGASLVRWLAGASPGLNSVRSVVAFCCAAALAAFLSSFLDAGLVRLVGFGSADFASLVQVRVPSNVLATLIFVPVAMTWSTLEPGLAPIANRRAHGGVRCVVRRPVRRQRRRVRLRRHLCRFAGPALPAHALPGLGRAALRAAGSPARRSRSWPSW